MTNEPSYMTAYEVACLLSESVEVVEKMFRTGEIPSVDLEMEALAEQAEVARYMNRTPLDLRCSDILNRVGDFHLNYKAEDRGYIRKRNALIGRYAELSDRITFSRMGAYDTLPTVRYVFRATGIVAKGLRENSAIDMIGSTLAMLERALEMGVWNPPVAERKLFDGLRSDIADSTTGEAA